MAARKRGDARCFRARQ